jgi:hypothetical protein
MVEQTRAVATTACPATIFSIFQVQTYGVNKERQYDVLLRVNALDVEKQQAEDR